MSRGWEIVSNPSLGPAFVLQNKNAQKCLTFPSDLSNTTAIFKPCNPNDPYQQMRFSYTEFTLSTYRHIQIRSYIKNGDSYYVSCLNGGFTYSKTTGDSLRPFFDTCQDTIDFLFNYDVSASRVTLISSSYCLTAPKDSSASGLTIESCNPTFQYQYWAFVRPGMLHIRPCNPTYPLLTSCTHPQLLVSVLGLCPPRYASEASPGDPSQLWGIVRLGMPQQYPSGFPPLVNLLSLVV